MRSLLGNDPVLNANILAQSMENLSQPTEPPVRSLYLLDSEPEPQAVGFVPTRAVFFKLTAPLEPPRRPGYSIDCWPCPWSFQFHMSWVRPDNLHFWQVSRWYKLCRSMDNTWWTSSLFLFIQFFFSQAFPLISSWNFSSYVWCLFLVLSWQNMVMLWLTCDLHISNLLWGSYLYQAWFGMQWQSSLLPKVVDLGNQCPVKIQMPLEEMKYVLLTP